MQKVSVIVPCFNEEAVLPKLFERLKSVTAEWNMESEIICVDDGSRDRTWELLQAQSKGDSSYRCLSLARNFGHQTAVSAGLYHAVGDAVVIIDADLQDPPEQIVRLLAKWREGYEVVFATRKKREDRPVKRVLAWSFYRLLERMTPLPMARDAGDFCLLDKKIVAILNALPERNRYLRGLRTWCGFRQISVEFERSGRAAGVPQYTFKKSFKLAMDGLFSFSATPLRLATYLGLWVSCFAFLGAAFTLLQKVFASQFARIGLAPGPGFPTVVISILFLGGVQLICLGILGEYIGRIYDEVKGRPLWIIRDHTGVAPASAPAELRRQDNCDAVKEILVSNKQFVLYCVIGACGVTLDFCVYSLLLKTGLLQYQAANAVGYASGTLLSFLLNARLNFKTRDWLAARLLSFCAVALIGWAASATALYLLVNRVGMDKYAAKLMTLIVVTALQYNLNRLLSFRKAN